MEFTDKFSLVPDGGKKTTFKDSQIYKSILLLVVASAYGASHHIGKPLSAQYIYSIVSLKYNLLHAGNASNESTSDVCSSAANNSSSVYQQQEQDAQDESSNWLLYFGIATGVPGTIACALLGSYSDSIGRKILFLLPAVGTLCRALCYVVVIYWTLPLEYLYIGCIIEGIGGSYYAGLLASYVSAADITTPTKSRTLMVLVVDACRHLVIAGAEELTGQLIASSGYLLPAFIMTGVLVLIVIVILGFLPETRPQVHIKMGRSVVQQFRRVFSFVSDRKSSVGTPRGLYWLGTSTFFAYCVGILGVDNIEKLFMLDSPLCWNSIEIGTFEAIKRIAWPVGTVILVFVMQRCCADESIGILVGFSQVAWLGFMSFATNDVWMYISLAVGSFGMGFFATIRSILSKVTEPGKQGAMLASLATIESFLSMGGTIASNTIYNATLPLMKGAAFLFSMSMVLLAVILLIILNVKYLRKGKFEERNPNIQEENGP